MLNQLHSSIYVPDGTTVDDALKRTTHLGIGAHQDDLEIMAIDGILHCFESTHDHFTGVVVTDGRASPRAGYYANCSDDEMSLIRNAEQKKAAIIGNYSAQIMLGYTKAHLDDTQNLDPQKDLETIITATFPKIIYTHNLADKHPAHVAVAINVINAIRNLESSYLPEEVYGCEVWRNLDWLPDSNKIVFDCSNHINLQQALLGVHDSQINGGKSYDAAALGRRLANATFFEPLDTDQFTHLAYAMDLTPLVKDKTLDITDYICDQISNFKKEVRETILLYNPT